MNPLETAFPALRGGEYTVTSPRDADYNCLAWAAGETDRWRWPDPLGVGYWPAGAPREVTLPAFLAAYTALGFSPCADERSEIGRDKVAIYALSGVPTHAARQLRNGRWTSTLGAAEDIEHDLADLAGSVYGRVEAVLSRGRNRIAESI